jgi:hypothetical protein
MTISQRTIEVSFVARLHGPRTRPLTAIEEAPLEKGRVPRVARLAALAICMDQLLRHGDIRNCAELARLGHVSRARITQIMNLLLLAPDILEEILFWPRIEHGQDPIHLRQLQPIALVPEWPQQRQLWKALRQRALERPHRARNSEIPGIALRSPRHRGN